MTIWRDHAPQLLVELADHIEAVLRELQSPPEQASHAAFEIVRRFAASTGGTSIYIPKVDQLLRYGRDEEIVREFRGDNVKAIARKYGISEVWVYAIIRRQRELRRKAPNPSKSQTILLSPPLSRG